MVKNYEDKRINYILLSLVAMNVMQNGSVIMVLFCVYNFLTFRQIIFEKATTAILMALSMLLSVFMYSLDILNEGIKVINYFMPYIVGVTGYHMAHDKRIYMRRSLLALFGGYALQIGLVYLYNQSMGITGRMLISVWTDELVAVTLLGLVSSFVIGFAFPVLIFDKSRWYRIAATAGLVFVVLINMQTATRTPFLMMLLTAAFQVVALLVSGENGRKVKILFRLVLFFVVVWILIACNAFGIRDMILESAIFERFSEKKMETGRGEIAKVYFQNMLDYPWGGSNVKRRYGAFAHNIWQQCYDYYGVFTAGFMLVVTISMIKNLIDLCRLKNKESTDYMLIGVFFSCLVQMGLEPVLTGYPILFWTLLLIHGMVSQYNKDRLRVLNNY